MYRLKQFLNSLEYNELLKLKKNMENGNLDIAKEIKEKIKNREKKHGKSCSTCSNDLDQYNPNSYTIIFGPEDFKKKASFCGLDCLEYFIIKLKELKKGAEKTEFSGISKKGDENAEKIK